jgi:polyhydroxybutyrate depolymerase
MGSIVFKKRNNLTWMIMGVILLSTASCYQTAAIATATPAATIQPGDSQRQLMVNEVKRFYLLHVPPGLNSQQPVPVVFVFHGFPSAPNVLRNKTGFNSVADVANFLVVYPSGVRSSWNVSEWDPGYAGEHNVDETAFIRQMLLDLGTIASVDPKRIYAVGFSQGGGLGYRLACEMSDIFAAIAPVSCVMTYYPCQPEQAVSVIHVHGLADTLIRFSGGGINDTPPVEQGIATWVQLDGCTGSAIVEQLRVNITHTAHTSCQAGTAVELYTIDSLDHSWPAKDIFPISEIIWEFFAAHPKP